MASILDRIRSPRRTEIVDRYALELLTAKEILGEVFGIRASDVDEMIRARINERRG